MVQENFPDATPTIASAPFPASRIMTIDELTVFLMHDIQDIMKMPHLNDRNAGTAQRTTFPCPSCGSHFYRPQERRRHIISRHTKARDYHCTHESCHRSFARSDVLKRHRRNVHRLM
ncbi:hypothetical protein [Absidia glauca]|uniref:C2H2-type domain-containing protein n=1 Tax=Absidia glauca TaxID=4829 RepID=A0A168LLF1_ABSGL|nr:hypothetical protein [Absidia glauca]